MDTMSYYHALSKEDKTDLLLVAIALGAVAGLVLTWWLS